MLAGVLSATIPVVAWAFAQAGADRRPGGDGGARRRRAGARGAVAAARRRAVRGGAGGRLPVGVQAARRAHPPAREPRAGGRPGRRPRGRDPDARERAGWDRRTALEGVEAGDRPDDLGPRQLAWTADRDVVGPHALLARGGPDPRDLAAARHRRRLLRHDPAALPRRSHAGPPRARLRRADAVRPRLARARAVGARRADVAGGRGAQRRRRGGNRAGCRGTPSGSGWSRWRAS